MHYYKLKLRLSGSISNEVRKVVSAPEFLILQFIHGEDSTIDVEEIKNNKVDLYGEKNRLKELYNTSLVKKDQTVDSIFGALGTLPERLPTQLLQRYNIFGDGKELFDENAVKYIQKENSSNPKIKDQVQVDREQTVTPVDEVNLADLM